VIIPGAFLPSLTRWFSPTTGSLISPERYIPVEVFTRSQPEFFMRVSVVQPWVTALPWKMQSILFSGLRGPDQALLPKIKQVSKWMRAVSQNNADPSKPYMNGIKLPEPPELEKELEHCFVHFVHHFADALAVIAYGHPDVDVVKYAAQVHYYIAEELFHFWPEPPTVFLLRHRDKIDGVDPLAKQWEAQSNGAAEEYMREVLSRFEEKREPTTWEMSRLEYLTAKSNLDPKTYYNMLNGTFPSKGQPELFGQDTKTLADCQTPKTSTPGAPNPPTSL
jgi:hypothetical protein